MRAEFGELKQSWCGGKAYQDVKITVLPLLSPQPRAKQTQGTDMILPGEVPAMIVENLFIRLKMFHVHALFSSLWWGIVSYSSEMVIRMSLSPGARASPTLAEIRVTTPFTSLTTGVCIFMASRIATRSPAATSCPSSTLIS